MQTDQHENPYGDMQASGQTRNQMQLNLYPVHETNQSREETVLTEKSVHQDTHRYQTENIDKVLTSQRSVMNLNDELLDSVRSRIPTSLQKLSNEDLISDLRKSLDSSELNQLTMLTSKDSRTAQQLLRKSSTTSDRSRNSQKSRIRHSTGKSNVTSPKETIQNVTPVTEPEAESPLKKRRTFKQFIKQKDLLGNESDQLSDI